MSCTEVPFADIRIPRAREGILSDTVRNLYELFGIRSHVFADADFELAVTVAATPGEWASKEFVQMVCERVADKTIMAHVDVNLVPTGLYPMDFVMMSATPLATDEVMLYQALGIEYNVVARHVNAANGLKWFIVLRDSVHHALDSITKAALSDGQYVSCIGSPKVAYTPVGIRTQRISTMLQAPKTVKFADVYERKPVSVMDLVEMFGGKYHLVDLGSLAIEVPEVAADRKVYILDGLGKTLAERAKAYCARLRAKDCTKKRGFEECSHEVPE